MVGGLDVDWGRVAWWLFGFALLGVALYVLWRFIGTFVFGIFLYYATRPVYKRVRYRVHQRSVASALSLTLLVLPALLLVSYTVAIAFQEFQKFADRAGELASTIDLGEYETILESYVEASEMVTRPQDLLAGNGVDVLSDVVLTSVTYLGTVGLFGLHLFIIVAIAFYLLRDDQKLRRWVNARFADDRGVLAEYLNVVDKDFNNIFFGNILNAILTGTIGAIVYSLLNLVNPPGVAIPYAALIGLLAGVASLVPVVGMKLVYVPVAGYLFLLPWVNQTPEATWFPIAFAAVSFVVVDTIPDLVLRPYVSGRSLHMGALMLAYVLGPLLFGWYGLFLVPMLLVLVVHFGRVILPELVSGRPIEPYAVDPSYVADEALVSGSPAAGARGRDAPGAAAADGAPDGDGPDAADAGPDGAGGGTPGRDADGAGEPPADEDGADADDRSAGGDGTRANHSPDDAP